VSLGQSVKEEKSPVLGAHTKGERRNGKNELGKYSPRRGVCLRPENCHWAALVVVLLLLLPADCRDCQQKPSAEKGDKEGVSVSLPFALRLGPADCRLQTVDWLMNSNWATRAGSRLAPTSRTWQCP